jgi:type IV pilus assembly protein PilC
VIDVTTRRPIFRRIPLEELSRFAGNLATCLAAGIRVPDGLRTCTRSSATALLPQIVEAAAERAASGMELSDALEPDQRHFPPFFIPMIRCGERVGRLDEALRYLEEHCRLLDPPTRMMRNTWLYPLVIVLFGSVINILAHLLFAPLSRTLSYVIHTLFNYGILAAVVGFFLAVPEAKRILDHVKLVLPVIGPVERELALNRFFHSFNMLYSTGGMRVEAMIRLAAQAIGNTVVRDDVLRAAEVIEAKGTITDAFAAPTTVTADQKATIGAGEQAGKLEDALAAISRATAESVQFRLKAFQEVFFRIVALVVILSIAGTLLSLIMTMRMRG